ncbi:MAG: hypothetical protein ACE5E9_12270 [Nitrospinaceae bacterium]
MKKFAISSIIFVFALFSVSAGFALNGSPLEPAATQGKSGALQAKNTRGEQIALNEKSLGDEVDPVSFSHHGFLPQVETASGGNVFLKEEQKLAEPQRASISQIGEENEGKAEDESSLVVPQPPEFVYDKMGFVLRRYPCGQDYEGGDRRPYDEKYYDNLLLIFEAPGGLAGAVHGPNEKINPFSVHRQAKIFPDRFGSHQCEDPANIKQVWVIKNSDNRPLGKFIEHGRIFQVGIKNKLFLVQLNDRHSVEMNPGMDILPGNLFPGVDVSSTVIWQQGSNSAHSSFVAQIGGSSTVLVAQTQDNVSGVSTTLQLGNEDRAITIQGPQPGGNEDWKGALPNPNLIPGNGFFLFD